MTVRRIRHVPSKKTEPLHEPTIDDLREQLIHQRSRARDLELSIQNIQSRYAHLTNLAQQMSTDQYARFRNLVDAFNAEASRASRTEQEINNREQQEEADQAAQAHERLRTIERVLRGLDHPPE